MTCELSSLPDNRRAVMVGRRGEDVFAGLVEEVGEQVRILLDAGTFGMEHQIMRR